MLLSKERVILLAVGVFYLAFVIYGSLVPLDFRYKPLAEAWEAFRHIRYLELGVVSRADWVANLPFAILFSG